MVVNDVVLDVVRRVMTNIKYFSHLIILDGFRVNVPQLMILSEAASKVSPAGAGCISQS